MPLKQIKTQHTYPSVSFSIFLKKQAFSVMKIIKIFSDSQTFKHHNSERPQNHVKDDKTTVFIHFTDIENKWTVSTHGQATDG